jgi:transmembrane sensor
MDDDESAAPRRAWRTETEWFSLLERITADDLSARRARDVRRRWRWTGVAATVVLLLGASAAGVIRWRKQQPTFDAVTTAPGQRLVVHLGDHSTITLGPASTLRYDRVARSREITLDGLADFRVEHDAGHPFVVHAAGAEITDVGTEFVVRAYSVDSTVHVAVSSGVVSVMNAAGDRAPLMVRAGEVALVRGTTAPLQVHEVNASTYAAWVGGTLMFDDDAFADVARELGRWFDVDIRLANPRLATRRVTAIYNDPSLPLVLDALSATLGVRYETSGRIVTFGSRTR